MIRNLDPVEFLPFGILNPEEKTSAPGKNALTISLPVGSTTLYQTAAETSLRCEAGFPVLSVSEDNIHFADFYLEKPVVLKPGIWFSLTAFQEKAAVQMEAILMPREVQTGPASSFLIRPKLQITSLCAFFYQELEQGYLQPGDAQAMGKLIYVDSGQIHCVAEGQDLCLRQGEMVLYAPDQWNMQYADIGQGPRIVTLTFYAEGCDFAGLANRRFQADPAIRSLFQQMLREQEQTDAYSTDMITGLLTVLLVSLSRQQRFSQPRPVAAGSENRIIRRAQQYIVEHVREKLSVPGVAAGIGVSASYLTALFQKNLQISPGEYLRRIKLQESKQLIREGQLNFTEIAQLLQYSTVHHFSRQFKEKFGITPSQYAKSVK